MSHIRTPGLRALRAAWAVLGLLLFSAAPGFGAGDPPPVGFKLEDTDKATSHGIPVDQLETDVPHLRLTWSPAPEQEMSNADAADTNGATFLLQKAGSAEFPDPETIYEGPDTASFRSGLPEGDVFYRVRAETREGTPGPWSRPLHVRVEYQSMRRAVLLFALGGLVVLATAGLVIAGARKDQKAAPKAAQKEENPS